MSTKISMQTFISLCNILGDRIHLAVKPEDIYDIRERSVFVAIESTVVNEKRDEALAIRTHSCVCFGGTANAVRSCYRALRQHSDVDPWMMTRYIEVNPDFLLKFTLNSATNEWTERG